MGANPHANGGLLLQDLTMPDFRDYAVTLPSPAPTMAEATRVLGRLLRDVMKLNTERSATSASLGRTRPPPTAWARVRGDGSRLDGRDPAGRRSRLPPTAA